MRISIVLAMLALAVQAAPTFAQQSSPDQGQGPMMGCSSDPMAMPGQMDAMGGGMSGGMGDQMMGDGMMASQPMGDGMSMDPMMSGGSMSDSSMSDPMMDGASMGDPMMAGSSMGDSTMGGGSMADPTMGGMSDPVMGQPNAMQCGM